MFGTDYDTPDGTGVRDYLTVYDALETAEPLEMYPFELTNELFIYQRAKVPISGDDVDLYVLVDRVV